MKEIITLQLGQKSNYLATHFWNLQEAYFTYAENEEPTVDHNVHFRGGIGAGGSETFTPRTVIYDLKGGFGSLRKYNALYDLSMDVAAPSALWGGSVSTKRQPVIESIEYQKSLDQGLPTHQLTAEQIRYWSDFNRVYYHPRSIVQLNEYELNSQLMPFENWEAGQDLFDDLDKEFDLLDRDVRLFAEECDQLQGIQLFASSDDAWGGFASRFTNALRDEFGKTSLWLWGREDITSRRDLKAQVHRTANVAKSLEAMAPQLSAYIRLSSPPIVNSGKVDLGSMSEWSQSALICTAVESVTLPSRLCKSGGRSCSLNELETTLNRTGSKNIFELEASLLPRTSSQHSSSSTKEEGQDSNDPTRQASLRMTVANLDCSPKLAETSSRPKRRRRHVFSQIEIRRCISEQQLSTEISMETSRLEEQGATIEIYPTSVPFPQLDCFPTALFPTALAGTVRYGNVGIRASLATSSDTQQRLQAMSQSVKRVVAVENRESLLNGLAEMAESYAEDWASSSDSGMDE